MTITVHPLRVHTALHFYAALARWFELQEESWRTVKQLMEAFPKALAARVVEKLFLFH